MAGYTDGACSKTLFTEEGLRDFKKTTQEFLQRQIDTEPYAYTYKVKDKVHQARFYYIKAKMNEMDHKLNMILEKMNG